MRWEYDPIPSTVAVGRRHCPHRNQDEKVVCLSQSVSPSASQAVSQPVARPPRFLTNSDHKAGWTIDPISFLAHSSFARHERQTGRAPSESQSFVHQSRPPLSLTLSHPCIAILRRRLHVYMRESDLGNLRTPAGNEEGDRACLLAHNISSISRPPSAPPAPSCRPPSMHAPTPRRRRPAGLLTTALTTAVE